MATLSEVKPFTLPSTSMTPQGDRAANVKRRLPFAGGAAARTAPTTPTFRIPTARVTPQLPQPAGNESTFSVARATTVQTVKPAVNDAALKATEKADKVDLTKPTTRLGAMEMAFQKLLAGINLKTFNPDKIDHYLALAAKRGVNRTESEKKRLRALAKRAKAGDSALLPFLALELDIGVPAKLRNALLASIGDVLINERHNEESLKAFLEDPSKPEFLKAHVKTIYYTNKVEDVLSRVDGVKHQLSSIFGGRRSANDPSWN